MDASLKNYASLIKSANNLSSKFQKQLIQVAVISSNQEIDLNQVEFGMEKESFCSSSLEDLVGLFLIIIKLFVHARKKEEFEEILTSHGFTQEFFDKFPLKQENKNAISTSHKINCELNFKPQISWAIDISLSNNSVLNKKILPQVILKIKNQGVGDDKEYVFSIDINKFHIMRFNLAVLLKELISLKKRERIVAINK